MKPHINTYIFALATFVAVPAFARDALSQVTHFTFKLKDGSTLYLFENGKMSREDRYGRAVYLKKGEILELGNGRKIPASGNEVARLDRLLNDGHRN